MSQKKTSSIIGAVALLAVAAYVSANYLLEPAVVDSGGGHAESSSYQLDASIGGPVIPTGAAATSGEATSANYSLQVNQVALMETPAAPPGGGGGGGGGGCVPGSSAGALVVMLAGLALGARRRAD